MYLEAFYRVLLLLVETVGAFFFLLVFIYAAATLFLQVGKRPLAATKRINSDALLCSPKTCVKRPYMLAFI